MSPEPIPFRRPPPSPPQEPQREPMFNLPPATFWLAALIAASFVLDLLLPGTLGRAFQTNLAFISNNFWPPGSDLPSLVGSLSLITYVLLHGDFMHLMLNLGFLLAFGSYVERAMGLVPYLVLFAVCAAVGALTEFAFRGDRLLILIGASGAVYGITGAALRYMFIDPHPGRQRTALSFVLVIMGLNLVMGLSGIGDFLAGAKVGWKAHAGGFVVGMGFAYLFTLAGSRRQA